MAASQPAAPAETAALPVAPDPVIRRIVERIQKSKRASAFAEIFDIFNIIIVELFNDDLEAWRARGESDPSIRKVAEQEDLPIAGSTLYLYMRIGELSARIGGVAQFPNLEPTHLREVLGLPTDRQIALLRQANDERWPASRLRQVTTVQRIKTELDEVRFVHRELDGALRQIAKFTADADGLLADMKRAKADPERIERVGALRAELREHVQAVHDKIEETQKLPKK